MPLWTCEQCGAQFPDSVDPPAACPICEDERQFVNWKGQHGFRATQWRSATSSSGAMISVFPGSLSIRASRSDSARCSFPSPTAA